MKVGEQIPVTIAGQTVCMAEVRELGEGTATLIVPAVRVVMATRTELTAETPESGGSVELLTDGVETVETPPATTEATPAPVANTEQAPTPVANADATEQAVEQVAAPVQTVEAPSVVAESNNG